MKNMKIEVNAEQPLDEIVKELERLGYTKLSGTKSKPGYVIVTNDGYYSIRKALAVYNTTLSELKEIK